MAQEVIIKLLEKQDRRDVRIINIKRMVRGVPFFAQVTYTRKYTPDYQPHAYKEEDIAYLNSFSPELDNLVKQELPIDDLDIVIISILRENFEIETVSTRDIFFSCDVDDIQYLLQGKANHLELSYRPHITMGNYMNVQKNMFVSIDLDLFCFEEEYKFFILRNKSAYYDINPTGMESLQRMIESKNNFGSTIEYLHHLSATYFSDSQLNQ